MASAGLKTECPSPRIRWEEPDCLLCGSDQRRTIFEASDRMGDGLWFGIVQCSHCGLRYTCPRPNPDSIGRFYPDDYAPHQSEPNPRERPIRQWLARIRGRPCSERRSLPFHGENRLLDFGCGNGSYLRRMRDQGWLVTGIDTSAHAVSIIRHRLGIPIFRGSLPHDELAPESFDVITMWQSLEHVHNPVEVLRAARKLLAPGGTLLVSVPNMDSLPYRWFGSSWCGLELPRHLIHFCPVTLQKMLEVAGFDDIKLRHVRHDDWLRSSARIAAKRPHSTRFQRVLANKKAARMLGWWCYIRRQSDCILATAKR